MALSEREELELLELEARESASTPVATQATSNKAQALAPNPQTQSPAEINSVLPDQGQPQVAPQPLPSLSGPQNSPRMGQALLRGALTTPRLAEQLVTGQGKFGKRAPQTIDRMVPALENPTGGEQIAEHVGGLVDPAALVVGGLAGKGVRVAYEALSPLESAASKAAAEFALEKTAQTANQLYKATLINNTVKLGAEGLAVGAGMTGTAEVAQGNRDVADVAEKMLAGGAVAATLGAFGGAVTTKKPKFNVRDKSVVIETPATRALDDQLAKDLAEQSRLSEQARSIAGDIKMQLEQPTSQLVDEAAQRAAWIEDNHIQEMAQLSKAQEATVDPLLRDHLETVKTDSWVKRSQGLHEVSTNLNAKLESLDAERKAIIAKLTEKGDIAKLQRTRAKLTEINGKIAQLQDASEKLAVTVEIPREGSTYDRNGFIKDAKNTAYQQAQKVKSAAAKGLIPEEQVPALMKAEFDNALQLHGVSTEPVKVKNFGDYLGQQVDFNNMSDKLGVQTGETYAQILEGRSAAKNYANEFESKLSQLGQPLVDSGMTPDQITYTMQYIEQGGFNPEAVQSAKLTRGAYAGPDLSPEQLEGLVAMRQLFDEARQQAISKGLKVGHVEGYIPLMAKSTGLPRSATVNGTQNPAFIQARQSGFLDPNVVETNIFEIGRRYGRQVGKASYLKDPFAQGIAEINKLKLSGNHAEAERFSAGLLDAMGIDSKKHAAEIFGQNIVEANIDTLTNLANLTPDPTNTLTEVSRELNKLMYESLVTSNPATLLKQFLQPDILGTAELGFRNIQASRAIAIGPKSALKQRAEGLLKYVLTDSNVAMTELQDQLPKSLAGKTIRAIGIPLQPTTKLYGKVERINRLSSIIGGIRKFEGALANNTLEQALEGLAGAEKARILSVLEKQGPEAAANLYGVIKNNRINFIYDAVNKPDILKNKLGQLIPFTGFARGIADQLAGNVLSKNYKQVAKMIAYPLVMSEVVKQVTGKEIAGSDPTSAVIGLATPSIAPQITQPATTLARTKSLPAAGKEFLKFTPVGSAQRLMKAKSAGEIFGIKDAKKTPGYLKQLAKDLK